MFAIAASYLIASIPFAYAAQVTISYGSSSMTATYSPGSYVNKQVSVDGTTGGVRIQVSNGSANSIDATYIYKCQGRDPSACSSQVSPVSLAGNIDVTYPWSQASDTAGTAANIMLVVHTSDAGGGRWLAFWSQGKKNPGQPYTMLDDSISSISMTASSIDKIPLIKSFIDTKGMLPMGAAWIANIVFTGALGFHDLEASNPPATTNQTYYAGSTLNNITGDKAFVFPYNGARTLNGVTLSSTPNYVTGDGICSGSEERADVLHGCLDCGSLSGYYCDISKGNKPLSSITLSVYGSPSIKVSNCNVQNTVGISFIINNQPTGTSVTSAQYALNGSAAPQTSLCTSAGSNIHVCNVTTPAVPGCRGTEYVLNPNSITFTIKFNNASSFITKTLTASFPAITVGSWACGQFGCESSLGENPANCCHDCGCAAGQYCDFAAGQPATSACKIPVSDSNLRVASASPTNFYTHNNATGDNVRMEVYVTNAPQSIAVSSAGCRVKDCLKSGLPCSAGCSISCTPQISINPDIYNSTCTMNFKIEGYDPLQNYSVYTAIRYSASYNNGTGSPISGMIETNAPVISVGSHWKGDGKCDPDESYATVCFDCPCPSGQYCDTANHAKFAQGDVCRRLGNINMSVSQLYPTRFLDSMFQHSTGFSLTVNNLPSGASVEPACSFAKGNVTCSVSCTAINATSGASCRITVPSMDYKTSPYYSSATKLITLGNNVLNISLSFSNGQSTAAKSFPFSLPDIVVEPTFHCGNNECEANLNESWEDCCIDCACLGTEEYCYSGVNLAGRCLNKNEIYLMHEGFPSRISCTIAQLGGECVFVEPLDINVHVVNPPSDMRLVSSMITMNNKSGDINCIKGVGQNYTCTTVLENIRNPTEGTSVIDAKLGFTISYTANKSARIQNISAPFTINISREKSDYVRSCESRIADLEEQEKELKKDEKLIRTVLAAITAATAGFCVACALHCGWCCTACVWGVCISLCVSGVLLPNLQQIEGKISQIKAQRQATCNANALGGLGNEDSLDIGGALIGAALAIVCVICLLTKGFGLGSSSANSGADWGAFYRAELEALEAGGAGGAGAGGGGFVAPGVAGSPA